MNFICAVILCVTSTLTIVKGIPNSLNSRFKNPLNVPGSCVPYGWFPGLYAINVPGIDTFNVLCDSYTAGPGWTVIQQRINGAENFYRSWKSYQEGFGLFDGDFFLGLEKIHLLTSSQQHELYIHIEKLNGQVEYAKYDDFQIAGEDDKYRLTSLGSYSGTTSENQMAWHLNQKFTTYDNDNDSWNGNCAVHNHGGWWYNACAAAHLNGMYNAEKDYPGRTRIYWYHYEVLKSVKMLIRPKQLM